MRLRQIALASPDLDAVTGALAAVFDLQVAFNDPHIHHYGLKNAVLPAGSGFLEVVQPIAPGASAGRFLARRGGAAGYMVIIQAADAAAERARVVDQGARVVDDIDSAAYLAAHFHPADFGGMLVSIDQQRTAPDYLEPYGDWWPAGPHWRQYRTATVLDLVGLTLGSADPDALAALWSRRLSTPLAEGDPRRLPLTRGEIRFAGREGPFTGIDAIDLKVADPPAILKRAESLGLDVGGGGVLIGGVRFRPIP